MDNIEELFHIAGGSLFQSSERNSNRKSNRDEKKLVVMNPLIIATDFSKSSLRISVSDTEIEIHRNARNDESSPVNNNSPPKNENNMNELIEELVLEDLDFPSDDNQTNTNDTDKENQSSDYTESTDNRPTGYSSSMNDGNSDPLTSPQCFQLYSPEYLIFNFFGATGKNYITADGVDVTSEISLANLTIEKHHTDQTDRIQNSKSSPSSNSDENSTGNQNYLNTPRYLNSQLEPNRTATQCSLRSALNRVNRIFPIEEISENSDNSSINLLQNQKYDKASLSAQEQAERIRISASNCNSRRPVSRRTGWRETNEETRILYAEKACNTNISGFFERTDDDVIAEINSNKNLFLPNKQTKLKRHSKCNEIGKKSDKLKIETIEIDPNDDIDEDQYHNNNNNFTCSCFHFFRKVFQRKHHIPKTKIVKNYFQEQYHICPDCKSTSAYF